MSKKKQPDTGFIKLRPIPGGPFDEFKKQRQEKKAKIPKNPDKMIDIFADKYGMDAVSNMQEVDIGDYVLQKGIIHALNKNVGRDIPWLEDGLKAVERRVLYIMWKANLYRGKFDKVAGIAGDMIKQVHPHGEQSAEDTIYRLGRRRTMMIPYIKPGGNFGNMEDMRPASPRYASASLSDYAMSCFFSEMGTKYPIFDVKDNYKYSDVEPVFLVSKYPNILMQWNQGIGKGAASYLGAFNSKELFQIAIKMLDDPKAKAKIYPDTPVPLDIINKKDLKNCFDQKEFKVVMRAKYEIVADKKRDNNNKIVDKFTIVFTSLPIGVTGDIIKREIIALKEKDNSLSNSNKKFPEVIGFEVTVTDKTPGGIRFIIEYEKGYDPNALVEKLFRSTSLQKTIGVKYVLISDNKPDRYTPRQILQTWITQRFDQKRRYYHQLALKAAKDRARLEAICLILSTKANQDEAINIIRTSKHDQETIQRLSKRFDFTEYQCRCIMDTQLKKLQKLDIEELKAERDQALADYKHYRKLLSDDTAIRDAIREDLQEGLKRFGKDRMADVVDLEDRQIDPSGEKYLIYNDTTFWTTDQYQTTKKPQFDGTDKNCQIVTMQNSDAVLLISSNGQTKILNGYSFTSNTTGIGFVQLGIDHIQKVIPVTKDLTGIAFVSSSGTCKIMEIEEALKSTKSKIINLTNGDTLAGAVPLYGYTNGMIATWSNDKLYYLRLEDFPKLKRTAAGNKLLKLDPGTLKQAAYIPADADYLMIYTEYGYMKTVMTSNLKITKRPKPIDMGGKTIIGIVPIQNGSADVQYYDGYKSCQMYINAGKMIKLQTDDKETVSYRLGTTIGSPVKVLKKGHNEFYQLIPNK